jgi:hypothetical protein
MRTECTCPVCNGTGRVPAGDDRYKHVMAGYDKETDTHVCRNCGGQTMWGNPTGKSYLRDDGTPCKHEYFSTNLGRCYNQYTCKHCGYSYSIDSGD